MNKNEASCVNTLQLWSGLTQPVHVSLNPWPLTFSLLPEARFIIRQKMPLHGFYSVDITLDSGLWIHGWNSGEATLSFGAEVQYLTRLPGVSPEMDGRTPGWPGRSPRCFYLSAANATTAAYLDDSRVGGTRINFNKGAGSELHRGTRFLWAELEGNENCSPVIIIDRSGYQVAADSGEIVDPRITVA